MSHTIEIVETVEDPEIVQVHLDDWEIFGWFAYLGEKDGYHRLVPIGGGTSIPRTVNAANVVRIALDPTVKLTPADDTMDDT